MHSPAQQHAPAGTPGSNKSYRQNGSRLSGKNSNRQVRGLPQHANLNANQLNNMGMAAGGAPMISMQSSQKEHQSQTSQRSVNKQALIGVNNAIINDGNQQFQIQMNFDNL